MISVGLGWAWGVFRCRLDRTCPTPWVVIQL